MKTEAELYVQREKEEGLTLLEDGSSESQESGMNSLTLWFNLVFRHLRKIEFLIFNFFFFWFVQFRELNYSD